jgi:hypothetical protein
MSLSDEFKYPLRIEKSLTFSQAVSLYVPVIGLPKMRDENVQHHGVCDHKMARLKNSLEGLLQRQD